MRALEKLADGIDVANDKFGQCTAWLVLLLVIIAGLVAFLRYLFAVGWVWMQDAYLWVNGAMFMLGAGYTLLHDKHVRVDFFYTRLRRRSKAVVDILGVLVFLLPSVAVIAWLSYPFVLNSWGRFEGSLEAGGLPGIYLLKSVLLLFCIPLALQALSLVIRQVLILTGYADAPADGDDEPGND